MAVLSLTDAQLAFGHVALLDHTAFSLEAGERVGLIGRNGTGKSSLLKVLQGSTDLDDGLLVRQQGLRCAFVAQEPLFDETRSVFETVADGLEEARAALSDYERLVARLDDEADEAALAELHAVQQRLERSDAWNLEATVQSTLDRLDLTGTVLVGELSGGLQKRVALARAWVSAPDVLLLDEPTNHLDVEAIEWLENLLRGFAGSLIFITHDRRFLDRVATRIVELDRGQLRSYPGNFSAYRARRAEQLHAEALDNARFDKLLAQEEVWIRKGVEARRTRNEGRVRQLEALRRERAERREVQGQIRLDVDIGERSGKLVAVLEDVDKSYGAKPVVRGFGTTILRGDKVGLIGPNGAGKSTLLKLILGALPPDRGRVKLGTQLEVAYFDQMRAQLPLDVSLAESIAPGSDWVEISGRRKHVMSYLGDFLFAPERARAPVRSLSGGERNRLLLARLFARPANVLVLDEPTNDLDIDTLELLEALLQDYPGTVFLVSHDRSFLDNVVTQVIVSEGDGAWSSYVGGYEDWVRQRPAAPVGTRPAGNSKKTAAAAPKPSLPASQNAAAASQSKITSSATAPPTKPAPRRKLGFKEQRELDALPERIANLEAEQAALVARLGDPALYLDTARAELATLSQRASEIETQLNQALTRWTELEGG